jgi:hypothetical protein
MLLQPSPTAEASAVNLKRFPTARVSSFRTRVFSATVFPFIRAFLSTRHLEFGSSALGHRFSFSKQQPAQRKFSPLAAAYSVRSSSDVGSGAAMIEAGLEDVNLALGSLITNASSLQGRQQQHLDHVRDWARALNIDADATPALHVAGTKGKGSVCAYTESILRKAGLKTGLFTSPHLMTVRERFRINGAAIDIEDFRSVFWDVWGRMKQQQQLHLQRADHHSRDALAELPAFFRFLTLLGFAAFKHLNADVSVIEVGLGGRLDATNIISAPAACCITSLGMDHMAVLGKTLDKIAFEKAGILKPYVPCILTPQKPEADAVVVARAGVVPCTVYRSGAAFSRDPQFKLLLQQQQPVVAENMTAAVALSALAALRLPLKTVSKSPLLLEWREQLMRCIPGAGSLTAASASSDQQQDLLVFPPDAPVPGWIIVALQAPPSTFLVLNTYNQLP